MTEKYETEKNNTRGHNRHRNRKLWWWRMCQMKNKMYIFCSSPVNFEIDKVKKETTILMNRISFEMDSCGHSHLFYFVRLIFIIFCDFASFFTHHFSFLGCDSDIDSMHNAHIYYIVSVRISQCINRSNTDTRQQQMRICVPKIKPNSKSQIERNKRERTIKNVQQNAIKHMNYNTAKSQSDGRVTKWLYIAH